MLFINIQDSEYNCTERGKLPRELSLARISDCSCCVHTSPDVSLPPLRVFLKSLKNSLFKPTKDLFISRVMRMCGHLCYLTVEYYVCLDQNPSMVYHSPQTWDPVSWSWHTQPSILWFHSSFQPYFPILFTHHSAAHYSSSQSLHVWSFFILACLNLTYPRPPSHTHTNTPFKS